MLVLTGAVPFVLMFGTICHEATTGDPPNSLRMFKAYHYISGTVVILALIWVAALFFATRGRRRVFASIAAVLWLALICFLAYALLDDINSHPAGKYYRAAWRAE
jgi:hypothetical protein